MNIIINLISLTNHLPPYSTYYSVAKGILDNLPLMVNATIFDMAEITNSSRTTIWRMIKLMGYSSYSQFQHELQQAVTRYPYLNWGLPVPQGVRDLDFISLGAAQLRESADLLEHSIQKATVDRIVTAMHEADYISFYDLPSTSIYFLLQNLAMAGKKNGHFNLMPDILNDVSRLSRASLVFAYPIAAPDMMDMTPVFQTVKEKGATLILAAYDNSRYSSYGDIVLFSDDFTRSHPGSIRQATEMLYIIISEAYRNRYSGS